MPNDIRVAVLAEQLEVPVCRRQPLIENVRYLDPLLAENDGARRLFAAVSRVALDRYGEHIIHATLP